MPQMTSKTPQSENARSQQSTSAGHEGAALSPPPYGIDFIDRQAERENNTGLPDRLKAGIESLSGLAMDDVRVHYHSSKPAQLQALAYTQGTEIHVGSGQERHLPHEAWHVVQQKQGRVRPTLQAKGVAINDDHGLEREADVMGVKAIQMKCAECAKEQAHEDKLMKAKSRNRETIQLAKGDPCYCPGIGYSPYWNLGEYNDQVGPGESFTATQVKDIFQANANNSSLASLKAKVQSPYESDSDNTELVRLADVNHLIAEVDHIVPQALKGCNSVKNAQIISSYENGVKGDTYPYGKYKGYSVFNPKTNVWK